MTIPRNGSYVWITWLSKLMAGDTQCQWGAWFKAHHTEYKKAPSDFPRALWQPDKGQVTIRYYGLSANAHRGKVRKASVSPLVLRMAEQEEKCIPSKVWAEMIRKV